MKIKFQDLILFIATIFQMIVFIVKGALPLAAISIGLIITLIINICKKENRILKIITLSIMILYLMENAIMTYVYYPSVKLPIILFITSIIMDIAILQKIIFSVIIKDNKMNI